MYGDHADKGLSIGDDICGWVYYLIFRANHNIYHYRVLKRKVNAPFVGPGPPVSKKFPNGIKVFVLTLSYFFWRTKIIVICLFVLFNFLTA